MKFNKKLVVTSLSTVLGLGIVGSITGTIAWYQYSTRGTASLIGASAGESGVLQLRTNNGEWKRDVASKDFFMTKLSEVLSDHKTATFDLESEQITGKDYLHGEEWSILDSAVTPNVYYFQKPEAWPAASLRAYAWNGDEADLNAAFPGQAMEAVDGHDGVYKVVLSKAFKNIVFLDSSNFRGDNKLRPCTWGGINQDVALPAQAYGNPILGKKKMSEWKLATSDFDYFQFTVQLQAVDKSDNNDQDKLVAKDVWLTDIVLKDADDNPTITEALRMHLDVWDGIEGAAHHKYMLISPNGVAALECYGELDLDGDNKPDIVGGYDWTDHREDVVKYGEYDGDTLQEKKQNAYSIANVVSTTYEQAKKIGTTVAKADTPANQKYLQVTVTVWIEGWAQLNSSAIWGPDTLNRTVHAGITFGVSDDAFNN